jgi:hypothetical protein
MAYGKWVLCTSTNILLLLSTFDEIQFSQRERAVWRFVNTPEFVRGFDG